MSDELMRVGPAVSAGVQLALKGLGASAGDIAEVFWDYADGKENGRAVDAFVKLRDGRTAIGTAFVPQLQGV